MRRTIDIGRLNKRITFQSMTEVEDIVGQSVLQPTDFKTVWASLAPTRGGEYYEAQKLREELTYKVYCRYFEGLTSDMTIKYGDTVYSITSVIDVDMQHKMYEIYCTEYVDKAVV